MLKAPIEWAGEPGIELPLEPHGDITDGHESMGELLDALGHEETVGVNLDIGNSWLGGGDPLEFIKAFGKRIKHVHWKDMGKEWLPKRGKRFGCGMGSIPAGDGLVGIPAIVEALLEAGFDGPTTLEVAGKDDVLESARRLREWTRTAAPARAAAR